jgi:hypothetical protein
MASPRRQSGVRGIERIGGPRHPAVMPDRSPALDALIRDAEAVAAERPDVLGTLIMLLDAAIASDTDPTCWPEH